MCNMPDYQTIRPSDLRLSDNKQLFNISTLQLFNFCITFAHNNSNTGSHGRKDKIFG